MNSALFLAAPPERRWPISLEQVQQELQRLAPDARLSRYRSPVTEEDTLSFDLHFANGNVFSGGYVDGGNLFMSEGTLDEWALIAAAVLRLLPSGTPAYAMVEADPTPVPLPDEVRSPSAIAALYQSLTQ